MIIFSASGIGCALDDTALTGVPDTIDNLATTQETIKACQVKIIKLRIFLRSCATVNVLVQSLTNQ